MANRINLFIIVLLSIFVGCSLGEQPKSVVRENVAVADIALLIDQSGSIKSQYYQELDFAKRFSDAFPVAPNLTRFALVGFSFANMTAVRLAWNDGVSKENIARALNSMQSDKLGAGTDFAKALTVALEKVMSPNSGDRPDAPNVVVLVTDGYFNNPWEREQAIRIAKSLRDTGALLYAIQVKSDPSLPPGEGPLNDLVALTANRSRVFSVENFDQLTNELLSHITRQISVEYNDCVYEYEPVGACFFDNGKCMANAVLKIERQPQLPHGRPCPVASSSRIDCPPHSSPCKKESATNETHESLPSVAEKEQAGDTKKAGTPAWAIIVAAVVGGLIFLLIVATIVVMKTPRWKAIFIPSKPGPSQLPGTADESRSTSSGGGV